MSEVFDPEKVQRLSQVDVERQTPVGDLLEPLYVRASDYGKLLAMCMEAVSSLRPAVVTSNEGVVEGIFTSWDAALAWAKQHQMDVANVRGGARFHDIQFPLRHE